MTSGTSHEDESPDAAAAKAGVKPSKRVDDNSEVRSSGTHGASAGGSGSGGHGAHDASETAKPEWANGLRQLYDSVVDEPLPDNFKDLLSKLDDGSPGGSPDGSSDGSRFDKERQDGEANS